MLVRALRSLAIVALAASSFAQDRSNAEVDPLWNALECHEAKRPLAITGTVLLPSGLPAEGAVVVSSAGGMAHVEKNGAYSLTVNIPAGAQSVQVTAVGGNLTATKLVGGLVSGVSISTGPLSMQVTTGCQPAWLPTFGSMPGTDGDVLAMATFDDGNGPALYLGGNFLNTGDTEAHYIARWNGSTWSALGTGTDNAVQALTVFDDGSGPALYAGGLFTSAGGVQVNGIAKWDGSTWSPLGVGMNGGINALAVYDDGSGPALYAGGLFTYAGGSPAHSIARWSGTQWSGLGSGVNNRVRAMCAHDDGTGMGLYAGGDFTMAGGAAAVKIARWAGGAWTAVGGGLIGTVSGLARFDDGSGAKLYAAGELYPTPGGQLAGVAIWDGSTWGWAGGGSGMKSLAAFDGGAGLGLYAGGISNGLGVVYQIAGAGAVNFNGADGEVTTLVSFDDGSGPALFEGGRFSSIGPIRGLHVAKSDSASTSAIGNGGLSSQVYSLAAYDDGNGMALYAGGSGGVFKWGGSGWGDVGNTYGAVYALAVFDEGSGPRLYSAQHDVIGKWNGAQWSTIMLGGYNSFATALAVSAVGGGAPQLYCGGSFYESQTGYYYRVGAVAGASVQKVQGCPYSGIAYSLAAYDDGTGEKLYCGGSFSNPNGIMQWDGATWNSVGGGVNGAVYAVRVADLGWGPELYVGGSFQTAGGVAAQCIAKWNGSVWSPLGSGVSGSGAFDMCAFDDGQGAQLYVGGIFTSAGGAIAQNLARWDGMSWGAVGSGLSSSVLALSVYDSGDCRGPCLVAGGPFTTAYDSHDSFIARYGCSAPGSSPGCYGGFCFGDVLSNCPCGNVGTPGHGCANSGGPGASLNGSGAANIASDTLVLTSSGELPTVLSIFLQGTTQIAPTPFGDGLRCVGGSLKRLYTKNAVAGIASAPALGDLSVAAMSAALGDPLAAGSTRYLQTYYRDSVLSFCPSPQGNSFNISSGIVVTWAP